MFRIYSGVFALCNGPFFTGVLECQNTENPKFKQTNIGHSTNSNMRLQMRFPLPFLFLIPALASADSPPDTRTLLINNKCAYPIWPGVLTANGNSTSAGFHLPAASNQSVTVSWDWIGRVWGRTNCTFDETTKLGTCLTGDCGGKLECALAGVPPTTLAEFTISGKDSQTFFDVSLVDGYDLDMAIVPEHDSADKPRKNNSPVCKFHSPPPPPPPPPIMAG